MIPGNRQWLLAILIAIVVAGGYYAWQRGERSTLPPGVVEGNGRIEAVEIDVATKSPGRVREIHVKEGEFVKAGQIFAQMDISQLAAQKRQANAQLRRIEIGIETANSVVIQREAERRAAFAHIEQRKAQLDAATRRRARSDQLADRNSIAQQVVDDDRAGESSAKAALAAAEASLAASEAAIGTARAQVVDAQAAVEAAKAAIESIEAELADGTLTSPRDGRIQIVVAQPGEVLAAGGRVVNLIDLSDVYMTFFLPAADAGRVAMGSEVRLVLDAAPDFVVPAKISYVADVAQFTPKTVETDDEREKLMFRVRAQVEPELLRKYIAHVKAGLPGTAYIRLDPQSAWPDNLEKSIVE